MHPAPVIILRTPYELALLGGSTVLGAAVAVGLVTSGALSDLVSLVALRLFGALLATFAGVAFWSSLKGNVLVQRAALLPLALIAAVYSASLFSTGPRGTLAGAWVSLHVVAHASRWYQLHRAIRRGAR